MAVRGTENFVYYLDNILGSGSTATVYFGRHKRKGDACAVKVFSNQNTERKRTVQENELEHMKKLVHKNIVACLAIEKDTRTQETALIMELCSEGSLQKLLTDPQYVHGLPETLFVQFLEQFGNGLHYLRLHGIGHRDIKPGNILCSREENGRITFKLTDFGASRELLVANAAASALYGTEEFLHPFMYNAVFINRQPLRDEYESCCELWSVGVTIYQIACGSLPFQAYGGRSNRPLMYDIISNKRSGVISGIQRAADAEVEWSENLPATCVLSQGLLMTVRPLLVGLMENNPDRQTKFDGFFLTCTALGRSVCVVVFHPVRCIYIRAYVSQDCKYAELIQELSSQVGIETASIHLLFDGKNLLDIVTERDSLKLYPRTSQDKPIILIITDTRKSFERNIENKFLELPELPKSETTDKNAEAVWAREACAYNIRAMWIVRMIISFQLNFQIAKQTMLLVIKVRLEAAVVSFKDLCLTFTKVTQAIENLEGNMTVIIENMKKIAKQRYDEKHKKPPPALQKDYASAVGKINQIREEYNDKISMFKLSLERITRLKTHTEARSKKEQERVFPAEMISSECEQNRCYEKLDIHCQKSKDVHHQFTLDKKDKLSYNQDQLHKFEKVKQEERLRAIYTIITQHCWPALRTVYRQWLDWFATVYTERNKNVLHIENDVKVFHEHLQKLSAEVVQMYSVCEDDQKYCTTSSDILKSIMIRQMSTVALVPASLSTGGGSGETSSQGTLKSVAEYSSTAVTMPAKIDPAKIKIDKIIKDLCDDNQRIKDANVYLDLADQFLQRVGIT